MIVEIDGQRYDVPDDATPEEIDQLTRPAEAPKPRPAVGFDGKPMTPGHVLKNVLMSPVALAEGAAALGSQAIAYPLSVAAGAGEQISPWGQRSEAREPPLGPEATQADRDAQAKRESLFRHREDLARGIAEQRAWQSALSYVPRSDAGKQLLGELGYVFKNTLGRVGQAGGWAAGKVAEALGAEAPEQQEARDTASEATNALVGAALPAIAGKAKGALGNAGDVLLKKAGERALRATEAGKGPIDKLLRESDSRPQRVGQAMLDEPGLNLRSPEAIRETSGTAASKYLDQMRGAVKAADQAGAGVDVSKATQGLPYDAAQLGQVVRSKMGVPQTGDPLDFLERLGQPGPQTLAPSQAWALRQRLDEFLRGAKGAQDPESTFLKQQVNQVRRSLSTAMDQSMEAAGQGDAWRKGNAGYSYMTSAGDLAEKGLHQRGHLIGASELWTAGPAAVAGYMHGGSPGAAGAALVAAMASKAAKTYGNPALARSLQGLGKAADWASNIKGPLALQAPGISPGTGALLLGLLAERRRAEGMSLPVGVPAAAAEEGP